LALSAYQIKELQTVKSRYKGQPCVVARSIEFILISNQKKPAHNLSCEQATFI